MCQLRSLNAEALLYLSASAGQRIYSCCGYLVNPNCYPRCHHTAHLCCCAPADFSFKGNDIAGEEKVVYAVAKGFGITAALNSTQTALKEWDQETPLEIPLLHFAFARAKVRPLASYAPVRGVELGPSKLATCA